MAVILMAINDHYLKFLFHNWFTGKLSDFLGLFYFPLFLSAVICLFKYKKLTSKILITSIIITDILFIGIKTNHSFNKFISIILFEIGVPSLFALDSSDLLALSMNSITFIWAQKFIENN